MQYRYRNIIKDIFCRSYEYKCPDRLKIAYQAVWNVQADELDRIITVNGRTLSDISEYERKKAQEKTPAEPVQTADKVRSFTELYDEYQRRHANDHFTREAHKHLAEIARRRQRDEQERVAQTEERERKNRP